MNQALKPYSFLAGFAAAGMVSAFLGEFRLSGDVTQFLFMGAIFGLMITICAWTFFGQRSIWKSFAFIAASAAACFLSFVAAGLSHDATRNIDTFRDAAGQMVFWHIYFAGGFVGAFIILVAVLALLCSRLSNGRFLLAAVGGSFIGGLLGIAGGSLSDFSLTLVWQTGMALVVALTLWFAGSLPSHLSLSASSE